METLDMFLVSLISIVIYVLLNNFIDKKLKPQRYFYFFVADENYEVSGYSKGTDTLHGVIEEFTKKYGYGIDFTVREITKEEFDSLKED